MPEQPKFPTLEAPKRLRPHAVTLLKHLIKNPSGLNFTQAGDLLNIDRAKASWYVRELEEEGYIDREGRHGFEGCRVNGMKCVRYLQFHRQHPPAKTGKRNNLTGGLHRDGGTRYKSQVQEVDPETSKVFQPGRNNKKLGNDVTKGRHKGKVLFSVTLEEGKTCPKCDMADICYGGNMHLARRWKEGPLLESAIRRRISKARTGSLVRLHVLGDFYSVEYARLWMDQRRVSTFGYTHRPPNSPIGRVIKNAPWEHHSIRFSWRAGAPGAQEKRGAVSVSSWDQAKEYDAIPCPQQSDPKVSCASCGLCWNTEQNIAFKEH